MREMLFEKEDDYLGDKDRYDTILDYLRDGIHFFSELYAQWTVAQNEQQT